LQPLVADVKTRIGSATIENSNIINTDFKCNFVPRVQKLQTIRKGMVIIMNIEIANRLVNLRKEKNFSQEALAEQLGISRQAVSKWERAEASPDTDNLILLARLYGISLDELLKTEDEIPKYDPNNDSQNFSKHNNSASENNDPLKPDETEGTPEFGNGNSDTTDEKSSYKIHSKKGDYVDIGLKGIHVQDKDGSEVHIGWNGIHVKDNKDSKDSVHIDSNGVFVNGKEYDRHTWADKIESQFPFDLFIFLAYIVLGVFYNAWLTGLLVFFMIPIWHSLAIAIRKRKPKLFAYPVLLAAIFFSVGVFYGVWHPTWVIFLTIPFYYSLLDFLQGRFGKKRNKENSEQA